MNQHTHHDHEHPATFTEVIRQGFPASRLTQELAKYSARPDAGHPAARRPARAAAAVALAVRKDQAMLTDDEKNAFKAAVVQLVSEGKYGELIDHHMDMSHRMHGTMGVVGVFRFLGWHRRYLLEFERELQRVDQLLRPTATEVLSVPYWRWPTAFPAWMVGFLPANDPVSGGTPPPRTNAPPPDKATASDVSIILNGFAAQLPGVAVNNYVRFTYGLEGWGIRPDETSLPAHNHAHSWIGGIMDDTSTSPTDPIFWLHHCEVDRLWHIWQTANPGLHPPLAGADRVMDPWTESYDDLVEVSVLGYQFQSTLP